MSILRHQPQSRWSSRDIGRHARSVVRVRGTRRESARVPFLTTPGAEPISTSAERARGYRRGDRVTHRAYTQGIVGEPAWCTCNVGVIRHTRIVAIRVARRCTPMHTSAGRCIIRRPTRWPASSGYKGVATDAGSPRTRAIRLVVDARGRQPRHVRAVALGTAVPQPNGRPGRRAMDGKLTGLSVRLL